MDSEPIIRFIEVSKAFKYRGGASRFAEDGDEEGEDTGEAEAEEEQREQLKRGEMRTALRNINLSILPGERVGIIGVNGSGKTTLLNIVAGLSLPTSGRVVGRGTVVPLSEVTRPLNGAWDGYSNLRVLARLLGFPTKRIDDRLAQIASFAGMKDAISEPVATYSRGMFARLAFAAALELDGDIYISDDVLGVGDQAYQAKCFRRLVDLCQSGKTLLFATHRLKLIEQLCTRAIWLDKGEVRADGHPALVTANYLADMVEEQTGGETHDIAGNWFEAKYGCAYPLPAPTIQATCPIPEPETGQLQDFPSGAPELGGIVALDLRPKPEVEGIVGNNEAFFICGSVNVTAEDVTVDLMLEIVRGKTLIYQSFIPEPVLVRAPRELVFEVAVDSSLLPDNVYRLRLNALLTWAGNNKRYISRADLFIATKDSQTEAHPRAKSFGDSWPSATSPFKTLDLNWRVVGSRGQTESDYTEQVALALQS